MTTQVKLPESAELPAVQMELNKDNPTFPEAEYDRNLAGLHRPTIPVEVLGKRVRFRVPAADQVGLVFEFLICAWKDVLLSSDKQNKMNKSQLLKTCANKYMELRQFYLDSQAGKAVSIQKEEEFNELAGHLLLNPQANEYLIRAINQCFPDLWPAQNLTTEAKMATFGHIGEYINQFKEVLGNESERSAATGS
jgi:hypothetical protein